ncbi:hypothetical protein [uncultured Clostridium sp.]|jgi:hypothetical protein|nr:hypothetical protein [uncultured Clostridium sp.]
MINKNEDKIILSNEKQDNIEKVEYKIKDNENQFIIKSEDSIEYKV